MCVSTALQESLEHILFLGNALALKYLPLVCEWCVNFNYQIIDAGNDDFSNLIFFLGKFYENSFASKPILIKTTTTASFPANPVC